jgi:hypothetical protein
MKKAGSIIVVAVVVILLSGCPAPSASPPPDEEEEGGIEQVDDLFVDNGGGAFEFQTNDSAYWGPYGYTLWAIKSGPQDPFDHREVVLNKLAGDSVAGYGIVFCQYDTGDPDVGETMLVAMINMSGEYCVGEVCGAQFSYIIPWTTTPDLITGSNQANVFRIDYASGVFTLSINGNVNNDFRDEEQPFHTHGSDGYIVVISPMDDFPANPVHVLFREQ